MEMRSWTLTAIRMSASTGDFGSNEKYKYKYGSNIEIDQNEIVSKFCSNQLKMSTFFNNSNSVASRSLIATASPGSIMLEM